MSIAIYPGSFDPITVGHIHIAQRACRLFDQVIIGIAEQNYKNELFTIEERVAFIHDALSTIENCQVEVFGGLTVEFAKKVGAKAIVRGLRAVSDYEYELQVAAINTYLDESVETVFLMAGVAYTYISSTAIKQLCASGAGISGLVSPMVEEALIQKLR